MSRCTECHSAEVDNVQGQGLSKNWYRECQRASKERRRGESLTEELVTFELSKSQVHICP